MTTLKKERYPKATDYGDEDYDEEKVHKKGVGRQQLIQQPSPATVPASVIGECIKVLDLFSFLSLSLSHTHTHTHYTHHTHTNRGFGKQNPLLNTSVVHCRYRKTLFGG